MANIYVSDNTKSKLGELAALYCTSADKVIRHALGLDEKIKQRDSPGPYVDHVGVHGPQQQWSKYGFANIGVGEGRLYPWPDELADRPKANRAARSYARRTGRTFCCEGTPDGLWVTRVG